ncbi:MAG: bifunctional DNA-formamidopyrimidine glycosylase/DNA-(apurinic or apyrimidinic site) lyase [Spirochaeta sp.]
MPELPEVHITVAALRDAGLVSRLIQGAQVEWPRTVGGDPKAFSAAVAGRRIADIWRRGKYILLQLKGPPAGWIVVHLRMSGRLYLSAETPGEYVRAALNLDDGRFLCLYAPRRFARMEYRQEIESLHTRLGPEPLEPDFSPDILASCFTGTRRAVKTILLDQSRIAGIGNIYADEALFQAEIHPCRAGESLSEAEIAALHAAIVAVLQRGIQNLGTSLGHGKSNFSLPSGEAGRNQEDIRVFRRTGLPCVRCGTTVQRIVVAQRGTHYCPRCQPP